MSEYLESLISGCKTLSRKLQECNDDFEYLEYGAIKMETQNLLDQCQINLQDSIHRLNEAIERLEK